MFPPGNQPAYSSLGLPCTVAMYCSHLNVFQPEVWFIVSQQDLVHQPVTEWTLTCVKSYLTAELSKQVVMFTFSTNEAWTILVMEWINSLAVAAIHVSSLQLCMLSMHEACMWLVGGDGGGIDGDFSVGAIGAYSGTPLIWTPLKCVLIRGVSSFQEANNTYLYEVGTWASVLIGEVSSFQGCPLRGVPLYCLWWMPVCLLCRFSWARKTQQWWVLPLSRMWYIYTP